MRITTAFSQASRARRHPCGCGGSTPPAALDLDVSRRLEVIQSIHCKNMSDNNTSQTDSTDRTNVRSLLEDSLDECQPIADFVKDDIISDRPAMRVDVRDRLLIVDLYEAPGSGVVFLDYAAGTKLEDTAFCGDRRAAHETVVEVVQNTECEVVHDEYEIAAEVTAAMTMPDGYTPEITSTGSLDDFDSTNSTGDDDL